MFQRQPLALFARLAALTLAALTAGGLAGALWWALDLFAHFRLQYVGAGAVLAALLVKLRHRRFAVLAGAVGGINVVPAAPRFTQPQAAGPRGGGGSLRSRARNVLG